MTAEVIAAIEADKATVATATDRLYVMLNDDTICRLLAVWSPTFLEGEPAHPAELWRGVKVDVRRLASALRCPRREVENAVLCARAARLVFPDGTVARDASAMLRALVARQFPRRDSRRRETPA